MVYVHGASKPTQRVFEIEMEAHGKDMISLRTTMRMGSKGAQSQPLIMISVYV